MPIYLTKFLSEISTVSTDFVENGVAGSVSEVTEIAIAKIDPVFEWNLVF